MEMMWYGVIFVFGAIIGSFLNVVLYRLHTGKSLNGRSHCMSCGKTLSWHELFPIFSYIAQGGRCRGCSAYIPSRYLVVELLTGLSYVTLWHFLAHDFILLALYFVLVSVFILIVVYDIRHTIIPDELTFIVGGVALAFVGYEFLEVQDTLLALLRVGAGLGAGIFFWALWFMSKGRWIGLGDAKLALPLGIIVGISGVFSMVVLSFWIGAGISLTILAFPYVIDYVRHIWLQLRCFVCRSRTRTTPNEGQHACAHGCCQSVGVAKYRRYFTIKSEVPFAPFLIAGFLLVQLFHADIFTITYTIFFE